ncbi:MAG: competence type IV pilus assembly protein ComGB [Paenisporosarcina sp.]
MVISKIPRCSIKHKKSKVPNNKKAQFLIRLSTLLDEGYTFHSSVMMLLPYHVENVKEASGNIDRILRNGEGVSSVLQLLGFPQSYMLPIDMSESHGRLNKAIVTLHRHISMVERAKSSLQQILLYPLFLFSMLAILFIAFRIYFLPNMKLLVASRQHNSTDSLVDLTTSLLHLPDIMLGFCVFLFICIFILRRYIIRKPIQQQIYLIKQIPFFSKWMKLSWTRGFAQETGTLLASGLSLQESLNQLSSQTYQPYLKEISVEIHKSIMLGETVEKAILLTDCFLIEFPTYIAHGESSGHLAKELLIYSDLLTEQIEHDVTRYMAYVQPFLFFVLAICILAAYLSILLPVYGMIKFV